MFAKYCGGLSQSIIHVSGRQVADLRSILPANRPGDGNELLTRIKRGSSPRLAACSQRIVRTRY
jgi:hypothetical protein